MSDIDIDKFYVSPYDRYFHDFDRTHPPSPSQQQEIAKSAKIDLLRDNEAAAKAQQELWENF